MPLVFLPRVSVLRSMERCTARRIKACTAWGLPLRQCSILASPTACRLRGYGRAGTQNDRLGEAVILNTGTPVPGHARTRAIDMPSAMPRWSVLRSMERCTERRIKACTAWGLPSHQCVQAGARTVPSERADGERRRLRLIRKGGPPRNGPSCGTASLCAFRSL